MKSEQFGNPWESEPKITVEPPVVESFLDPARAAEVWPKEIATNEVFLRQIEERKELNERLDDVLDRLPRPDMPLEAAIERGHITEEQVAKLYESLSNLLESGKDYRRIILYLPFEFLPNKDWKPAGEDLRQSQDRFKQTYMEAWKSLLSTYDTRANFVDGDIVEAENRDSGVPRVVKAAHLIPKLVQNGLMEIKDVIALVQESDDEKLKNSVADALPVLSDMELVSKEEIAAMKKSKDWLVRNMAVIISSNRTKEKRAEGTVGQTVTFLSVSEKLRRDFLDIDSADYSEITQKRKDWLIPKKKQDSIESSAEIIGAAVENNNFADSELANFLAPDGDTASLQALVEGIRKAIESAAANDVRKAADLYSKYGTVFTTLWEAGSAQVQDSLAKAFRRLNQLGIVGDDRMEKIGISIPNLAGPFSENLNLIEKEIEDTKAMTLAIESDAELSQLVYPLVLVFGSRLKGYGARNADVDLAIFVKPRASFDKRPELRAEMSQAKIPGDTVEFWLQEKEGKLLVRDLDRTDVTLGENYWCHILFGAAWEGDKEIIDELRQKLLAAYLFSGEEKIRGREKRKVYLGEMERDALQYRLMHKGYEKFFPPYGGIHSPHSDDIDGDSVFYDSGYRQLATKLYARQVFLPKIPNPQK